MKNFKNLTLSLVAVLAVSCMEVNAMHRTFASMARNVARSGMGAFNTARIKEMKSFTDAYRHRTRIEEERNEILAKVSASFAIISSSALITYYTLNKS